MKPLDQRLIDRWRAGGASPALSCRMEQLDEFEQRALVMLPADVRRFLLIANGMDQTVRWGRDDDGIAFWPIDRWTRADEELQRRSPSSVRPAASEDYYAFADYLDWSWAYAIKLRGEDTGRVVLIGGDGVVPEIAASFTAFLERYVDGSLLGR